MRSHWDEKLEQLLQQAPQSNDGVRILFASLLDQCNTEAARAGKAELQVLEAFENMDSALTHLKDGQEASAAAILARALERHAIGGR